MKNQDWTRTLWRIAWVGGLVLVAGLVISAMEHKQASLAAGVLIQIDPMPDSTMLIKESDVLVQIDRSFGFALEGRPLKSIDVTRVERVLEEDPLILDADVFVDAKNMIRIEIVQREPVLRIIDRNGLNYYLDEKGIKMPLSKHFTTRVLVATGSIPPYVPDFQEQDNHRLLDVFELAQRIREDDFLSAMIEQIHVEEDGDFIMVPLVGDQRIILGPYERVDEKLKNLKLFYREGMPYEGWRTYRSINLSYRGQVVCK